MLQSQLHPERGVSNENTKTQLKIDIRNQQHLKVVLLFETTGGIYLPKPAGYCLLKLLRMYTKLFSPALKFNHVIKHVKWAQIYENRFPKVLFMNECRATLDIPHSWRSFSYTKGYHKPICLGRC